MRGKLSDKTGGCILASRVYWRRVAAGMGVLAALLCVHRAQATGHGGYDYCEIVGGQTRITAHVVGYIKTGIEQHDMLTDWIDIPPLVWTCTRHSKHSHKPTSTVTITEKVTPLSPVPPLPSKFTFDGDTYSIYKTNHGAGVGYIMRHRYSITPSHGAPFDRGWQPLKHTNDFSKHYADYALTLPNKATYTVTFESKVRLLKISETSVETPTTGVPIEFKAATVYHWRKQHHVHVPGLPKQGGLVPHREIWIRAWFNREDKTCTTPSSQTVRLPVVSVRTFNSAITAGNTPFKLELTNCSSTITGIKYKLAPVPLHTGHNPTAIENKRWNTYTNGILPNTVNPGNGGASGVGIQVLKGDGTPVTFDRHTTMLDGPPPPYSPGQVIRIPLQAQYIKTDTVTPGKVRAVMTVLYMYK